MVERGREQPTDASLQVVKKYLGTRERVTHLLNKDTASSAIKDITTLNENQMTTLSVRIIAGVVREKDANRRNAAVKLLSFVDLPKTYPGYLRDAYVATLQEQATNGQTETVEAVWRIGEIIAPFVPRDEKTRLHIREALAAITNNMQDQETAHERNEAIVGRIPPVSREYTAARDRRIVTLWESGEDQRNIMHKMGLYGTSHVSNIFMKLRRRGNDIAPKASNGRPKEEVEQRFELERELRQQGKPTKEIAAIVSERFGYEVNDEAVRQDFTRMKRRGVIFQSPEKN